jgi:opacity protein-like surface antigen
MINARIIRAGPLAALMLIAVQAPGAAQVKLEAHVSPMVTGTFYLGDPPAQFAIHRQDASPLAVQNGQFDDAFGAGVNAGLRIADRFGLEGMIWWLPTELKATAGLEHVNGGVDVNALMYGVTLAYYLPVFGRIEPFVGIGVGGETVSYAPELTWERHTDLMGNAVLGANFWIADRMAVRFEGRDCITRFDSEIEGVGGATENDLMISVGLTLRARIGR